MDYQELIERLRVFAGDPVLGIVADEAADLIEAQQKRIDELESNLDSFASECLAARQMAKDVVSKNQNLFNALMESTKLSDNLYCKGHKLAFVLECILLATDSDMAAISKYWDEAHEAIEEWRK